MERRDGDDGGGGAFGGFRFASPFCACVCLCGRAEDEGALGIQESAAAPSGADASLLAL